MFLPLLQRNADYDGDGCALSYGQRRLTHTELLERVERAACGLRSLGIGPGDKVALLLENSPEFVISFFAIAACRAVVVPLNTDLKKSQLSFYIASAEASWCIVDEVHGAMAAHVATELSGDVRIIAVGGGPPDSVSFERLLAGASREALQSPRWDDDIVYMYSSGSTGQPKCVPRTVLQYWWEMSSVIEGLGIDRSDRILCVIPLYHNFGAVQCMLAAAGSGAQLVMLERPNPFALRKAAALELLETQRITIFPGVPFIFENLAIGTNGADLSAVRVCYSAAAVMTQDTADAFLAKFGIPVRQHYGCTEAGAISIDLEDEPAEGTGVVGTRLPGVRIRIVDENACPVPAGQPGEVVIGSRARTRGYLGLDELNRETFRDGYYWTGDLGVLSDAGQLHLTGRKKHLIDVVGHKFSPMEVEEVLASHPLIREAIVIGVPNRLGDGEVVEAYVALRSHCDRSEIFDYCHRRLPNYKVPQLIEFISDVPRNTMGKPIRDRLTIELQLVQPQKESVVA